METSLWIGLILVTFVAGVIVGLCADVIFGRDEIGAKLNPRMTRPGDRT